MKICNRCKKEKDNEDFFKDCAKNDGLSTLCKACKKIQKKEYKATPFFKELKRAQGKRHYRKHREELLEYRKEYYEANKEDWTKRFLKAYYNNKKKYADRAKKDRGKFPGRHRACTAKYRASKLQATPLWADLDKIKKIYEKAVLMEGMEVDHIIPLQNNLVCGLHCENNLQILPMVKNRSKGNKFKPIIVSNEL